MHVGLYAGGGKSASGAAVVKLPQFARVQPFVLGGGVLVFDPANNAGTTLVDASTQTRGTFLYGAHWRPATRRSNDGYLKKQIYPRLEHVALKDISKFQVQMLFNQLAAAGYSYNVVYHVRDIIKAALAEALDQEVLERNIARKTVIPDHAQHLHSNSRC